MSDINTCEFGAYNEEGEPVFECHRTDYVEVEMDGDRIVRLCQTHRSWAIAMGTRSLL